MLFSSSSSPPTRYLPVRSPSALKSAGVIAEDGSMGDSYYDDDDAFEFLLDRICQERGISGDRELRIASFLDDYMDAQQSYMEKHGLLEWD